MPDVFTPGNLIRIKDFKFEDGNTRDKYMFVLLRNDGGAYVISSLTTSQNKLNVSAIGSGCYYDARISTYYHFSAGEVLGDGDFYFDKDTYIFFRENIRRIEVAALDVYVSATNQLAAAHITTLKKEELKWLLQCVINSKFTPKDLKDELATYKDSF